MKIKYKYDDSDGKNNVYHHDEEQYGKGLDFILIRVILNYFQIPTDSCNIGT